MRFNRGLSLQDLEGVSWGEPTYNSYLVTTVHRLRRKPLAEFGVEDLRIMIGQNVGLKYLVPLAVEQLLRDPLAEGDYYPGDLLRSVLSVEPSFWKLHPDLWGVVKEVALRVESTLSTESGSYDEVTKDSIREVVEVFRRLADERE